MECPTATIDHTGTYCYTLSCCISASTGREMQSTWDCIDNTILTSFLLLARYTLVRVLNLILSHDNKRECLDSSCKISKASNIVIDLHKWLETADKEIKALEGKEAWNE